MSTKIAESSNSKMDIHIADFRYIDDACSERRPCSVICDDNLGDKCLTNPKNIKITKFVSKLENNMNEFQEQQQFIELLSHSESSSNAPIVRVNSKLLPGKKLQLSKKYMLKPNDELQRVIVVKSKKSGACESVLSSELAKGKTTNCLEQVNSKSETPPKKKLFLQKTKNITEVLSSDSSPTKHRPIAETNQTANVRISLPYACTKHGNQSSSRNNLQSSIIRNEIERITNVAVKSPSVISPLAKTVGSPSSHILPIGSANRNTFLFGNKSQVPSVAVKSNCTMSCSDTSSEDSSLSESCDELERNTSNAKSKSLSRSNFPSEIKDEIPVPDVTENDENITSNIKQRKMYGCYTRDLSDYAKEEARKMKNTEKYGKDDYDLRPYRYPFSDKCVPIFQYIWKKIFSRIGEDWIFLAVLGIIMACISFLMDRGIGMCNKARIWLYRDLAGSNVFLQYMSWIFLPICLILFSASFVHLMAPQSVGSGIPEMKTVMRGVVLKEYLTFKTLVAKIIGLTATLGTGLPLGKEGPFVHIASMVATLLSKAVTSFKGIYQNESKNSEMLAAACAVGVACSFAAPIGGVLFSIEVTTTYFAVRNYWRGFFAAVCGAMMFRLLAVWSNDEETLTALFETSFKNNPYDSLELFAYAVVGVLCGFLGAFFVWLHRQYVFFMRKNKKMKAFLQKSRLLYPLVVTLVLSTLNFPPGFGMFVAGELTTHEQVAELFSNISWTKEDPIVSDFKIIENWRNSFTNIFVNLILYFMLTFTGCVVASTLPVPSGIFIPVFKMGASLGRLVGEIMGVMFIGKAYRGIVPGGYATVGAAAFSGAVTHTISTSVIVFELTGQIVHIIPVMLAVLIANGIAQLLQPSIYDSIIQIKKLPYLPDIITSTAGAYNMFVEDFMVRNVKYIWYGITYRELKTILLENRKIRSLPLVDSPESMILLGSIQRAELITRLEQQMGKDRRSKIAAKWKFVATKARSAEHDSLDSGQNKLAEKIKKIDPDPLSIKYKKELNTFQAIDMPSKESDGNESEEEYPNNLTFNHEKPLQNNVSPHCNIPMITASYCSSETSVKCQLDDDAELEYTETDPMIDVPKRRPSRFEVTKVETPYKNESSVTLQVDPVETPFLSQSMENNSDLQRNTLPRKSILKKTRSFTLNHSKDSPDFTPQPTPYVTVHAGDSKLRQVIEAVLNKRNLISKLESRSISKIPVIPSKTSMYLSPVDPNVLYEKTMELRRKWEEEELSKKVDFDKCQIDPAPFQLVERTSLLKVHSLFSMLGLNHAYVTAIGRLIGVVALKELRKAIEDANLGDFPAKSEGSVSELGEQKTNQ